RVQVAARGPRDYARKPTLEQGTPPTRLWVRWTNHRLRVHAIRRAGQHQAADIACIRAGLRPSAAHRGQPPARAWVPAGLVASASRARALQPIVQPARAPSDRARRSAGRSQAGWRSRTARVARAGVVKPARSRAAARPGRRSRPPPDEAPLRLADERQP